MRAKVSISLDASVLKRVDALAAAMCGTRSKWFERLILDGLEEREDTAKALSNPNFLKALAEQSKNPKIAEVIKHTLRTADRPQRMALTAVLRQTQGRKGKA